MGKVIVLLALPESPLAGDIIPHLDGGLYSHYICSLDAPMEGKPVTAAPGRVIWEGVDLLQADAIFVEMPVFPWPQVDLPPERFRMEGEFERGVVFQREALSLIVSAVRIAGEARRMINRPDASHLAISPSIALDLLSRRGIQVHPWRLAAYAHGLPAEAGFAVDASGADRRHSPTIPRTGEPALIYEPFPEEVVTFLVVGKRSAGALVYRDGAQWAERARLKLGGDPPVSAIMEAGGVPPAKDGIDAGGGHPRLVDSPGSFPEEEALAVRAAGALELDVAAISVRAGAAAPGVLLCEAAPDLAAWNRILQGRLAGALAGRLMSAASA